MATQGFAPAAAAERVLIADIRARLAPAPPWLLVGPGDDAAVVEPPRGDVEILTTDCVVEGVHFDRRFASPRDIGFKALAVNVSDVAAMGAAPRVALVSLLLPEGVTHDDALAIVEGVLELAASTRVTVAGGNISRTPGPLVVSVTVIGAARRRQVLRRSGARPGDAIFVTGTVGDAAAGFAALREAQGAELGPAVQRHLRPDPRLRPGLMLARNHVATACMDTSDGFADAVSQIAAMSGVGARIDAEALPFRDPTRNWLMSRGADPVDVAAASDDYELVFTAPPRHAKRVGAANKLFGGVPIAEIGVMTKEPGLVLLRDGREEPLPGGYVHDLT